MGPTSVRLLRYHMKSGHVLQEEVDREIPDTVDDATLLQHVASALTDADPFIAITECTSDSAVLVISEHIEFIQVGRALKFAPSTEDLAEAEASEDASVLRAQIRLVDPRQGDHDDGE